MYMKGQLALQAKLRCKHVPLLILEHWIGLCVQLERDIFESQLIRDVVHKDAALLVKDLKHVLSRSQNHIQNLVVPALRNGDLARLVKQAFERSRKMQVCSLKQYDKSCGDRELTADL